MKILFHNWNELNDDIMKEIKQSGGQTKPFNDFININKHDDNSIALYVADVHINSARIIPTL